MAHALSQAGAGVRDLELCTRLGPWGAGLPLPDHPAFLPRRVVGVKRPANRAWRRMRGAMMRM